jgi:pimeloyl-ACP methyl ester carboxylesterase
MKRILKWTGRIVLALVVLVVAGGAIAYWSTGRETGPLDAAARKRLGGSYAKLSDGVTHYKWVGPANGRVVVMLHGGTVPHWAWEVQLPGLTKAGFRVLLYDMYGRGYSDRIAGDYDRALYARQLKELLEKLGVRQPVDLVTTSFGSAVAAHFTASHPDRARRLVLIAPLVNSVANPTVELLKTPVLGPVLLRVVGIGRFKKRAAVFFAMGPDAARYGRLFAEQFTWEGTERALISMLKTDALGDYRPEYRAAASSGRAVLIIRGNADTEITADAIAQARRAMPLARYIELPGIGHGAVLQAAKRVSRLTVDFLKR